MANQYQTKFLINTFSGMIGGLVCLTVIYPMDYPRVMLVRINGIKDFYKNFTINSIPYLINKAIYFGIFDSLKGNLPQ